MHTMTDGGASAGAKSHILLPDGNIILAGYQYNHNNNAYYANMVKFNTVCGKIDSTFADNGFWVHRFSGRTILHDITVQADGKILGYGYDCS